MSRASLQIAAAGLFFFAGGSKLAGGAQMVQVYAVIGIGAEPSLDMTKLYRAATTGVPFGFGVWRDGGLGGQVAATDVRFMFLNATGLNGTTLPAYDLHAVTQADHFLDGVTIATASYTSLLIQLANGAGAIPCSR